jgi:hypothetical protein
MGQVGSNGCSHSTQSFFSRKHAFNAGGGRGSLAHNIDCFEELLGFLRALEGALAVDEGVKKLFELCCPTGSGCGGHFASINRG